MLAEPMTLYKLMNLYMLHQVNFPLTNAQLSNFFLDREYTTYFTLQQALNELLDAGLVKKETMRNSSRYEITKEGAETLRVTVAGRFSAAPGDRAHVSGTKLGLAGEFRVIECVRRFGESGEMCEVTMQRE